MLSFFRPYFFVFPLAPLILSIQVKRSNELIMSSKLWSRQQETNKVTLRPTREAPVLKTVLSTVVEKAKENQQIKKLESTSEFPKIKVCSCRACVRACVLVKSHACKKSCKKEREEESCQMPSAKADVDIESSRGQPENCSGSLVPFYYL